jgi:hypothetical protein
MLDFNAAKLWILAEVKRLGLGPQMDNYDGWMLYHHGGGRGKPEWAERIGKKYQWIALYRLIGMVADNVPVTPSPWDHPLPPSVPPALQAPGERNLDPTILMRRPPEDTATSWWVPFSPDFFPHHTVAEWLEDAPYPDSRRLIEVEDPQGRSWLALQTYANWDDRTDKGEWDVPYRSCFMQVRSYLIDARSIGSFWSWVAKQNLEGRRQIPEGAQWIEYSYGGEYPWAVSPQRHLALMQAESDPFKFPITPTANDQSLEFGFDSYHEETISYLVPHPRLLERSSLHWDGVAGYRTPDGTTVIESPDLTTPGPRALLVRRDWLKGFLAKNGLAIVWTILSEKQPHDQGHEAELRSVGWSVHSRAYTLRAGRVIGSKGITLRRP